MLYSKISIKTDYWVKIQINDKLKIKCRKEPLSPEQETAALSKLKVSCGVYLHKS